MNEPAPPYELPPLEPYDPYVPQPGETYPTAPADLDRGVYDEFSSPTFVEPHPWRIEVADNGDLTINAGQFSNLTPTNLTGLNAPASGTRYLVLTVNATLTAANAFVTGFTFDDCSLGLQSTAAGDSDLVSSVATFKINLALIVDRVVVSYYYKTSLDGTVHDDQTETSTGRLGFGG